MPPRIAVAIVHGVGNTAPTFADELIAALQERIRPVCGDDVVIRPVYWSPVLQPQEDALWSRMAQGGPLHYASLREVLIDLLGDGIAYQPLPDRRMVYDAVHQVFADTLHQLASEAGADAPLAVIAHSLGTVITSNYFYDLQTHFDQYPIIPLNIRERIGDTPLERGETLALLHTLGSPLAVWSLRYGDFGQPIRFPAPQLGSHYPDLPTEWLNLYDADDVIGYPLKTLNDAYRQVVTADRAINTGNWLESWNPLSHVAYWGDKDVHQPIADGILRLWQALQAAPDSPPPADTHPAEADTSPAEAAHDQPSVDVG